jgi:hypothetical protein
MKDYLITDYREQRYEGFKDYYVKMMSIGDCDPGLPALRYIADRFELNDEQKYWLAFLYSICYNVPTAFFMYNEFPDYENVDTRRVAKWWAENKDKCLFTTDRIYVKSNNKVVPIIKSYQNLMGLSQKETFSRLLRGSSPEQNYKLIYPLARKIYYMGRFAAFIYLEALNAITEIPIRPDTLELEQSESSRNGLLYALNLDEFITLHHQPPIQPITKEVYRCLNLKLAQLQAELKAENPEIPANMWNIETALCAYKKLFWKDRYLGYYIDRQRIEIRKMQRAVKEGVDWSVLWDFRREYFYFPFLAELGTCENYQKDKLPLFADRGILWDKRIPMVSYKYRVSFQPYQSIYSG